VSLEAPANSKFDQTVCPDSSFSANPANLACSSDKQLLSPDIMEFASGGS
jgi:hypothetical protein